MAWGQPSSARPAWLAQLERDDPALKELVVIRPLDASTWALASAAIARSTQLKTLIAHKALAPETLAALAAACGSSRLESISIGTHELGDAGLSALLSGLAQSRSLVACDLESRGIGSSSAETIASFIVGPAAARLQVLNVSRNAALGDVGLKRIAEAIQASQLTSVDAGGTTVGAEAAEALGRMCSGALRLQRLSLKGLCFGDGDGDASHFARAMSSPATALATLDLSEATLGHGARAVLRALAEHAGALTDLDLTGVRAPADAWAELGGLLALSLRKLSLHGTDLGDDGAAQLACAIEGSRPPLESLRVGANRIRAIGALLRACAQLESLRSLDCIGNPCGDGARALAQIIADDPRGRVGGLSSLSLSGADLSMAGFAEIERALCSRAAEASTAETFSIECAQNPACKDEGWEAAVERVRQQRADVRLVWQAFGSDAEPSSSMPTPA